jgi:glycosyltransferase AglD
MGGLARLRGIVAPDDRRGLRRRRLLRVVGLAVLVGFAAFAIRHVDLRTVGAALVRADPSLVLLAALSNVLSLAVHSKRWAAVIHLPAGRLRFRDAFAAATAGFAVGIVVPARAGDLVRSWILARRTGVPTVSVVAAAGLDYVVGAAALVPLLALLALAPPLPSWARHALLVLAATSAVGGVAAYLLRPSERRPAAHGHGLVARLRAGLAATRDPAALGASFGWALAGWAAEILIAIFTLGALGLPMTIERAALAVLAATAANVVAVSPGNTGPFELAVVLALVGLGIPSEPALAFAILYHLVHLGPVAVLGGGALLQEARADRGPVQDVIPGP